MSITATDEDPDEAIRIADAFGAELIAYLEAEDAARADEATAAAAERAEALQTRITDLEALIAQNPANVAVLSAERDALVRQYSVVFEDQNEGVAPNRYSTIEAATAVRADEGRFAPPSSAGQRMLLAGLVALILGGALALFIDRADNRIRTRRHAEAAFGLPVIAEIPAISGRAGRRGVVVADNPGSQVAEAFRTLRTSAQLFARSGPTEADQPGLAGRRVFLVTSTDAGEGKSTTAANLAAAFAETGRSVLLIDWDLSRPALGHLMRTETSRGVADVLVPVAEAPALADLCVPTSVPGSGSSAPARRLRTRPIGSSGRRRCSTRPGGSRTSSWSTRLRCSARASPGSWSRSPRRSSWCAGRARPARGRRRGRATSCHGSAPRSSALRWWASAPRHVRLLTARGVLGRRATEAAPAAPAPRARAGGPEPAGGRGSRGCRRTRTRTRRRT